MIISGGGCFVVPGLHRLTKIPLELAEILTSLEGESSSVQMKNKKRFDLRVSSIVSIPLEDKETLFKAIRYLKHDNQDKYISSISGEHIKEIVQGEVRAIVAEVARRTDSQAVIDDSSPFSAEISTQLRSRLIEFGLMLSHDVNISFADSQWNAYKDSDLLCEDIKKHTDFLRANCELLSSERINRAEKQADEEIKTRKIEVKKDQEIRQFEQLHRENASLRQSS